MKTVSTLKVKTKLNRKTGVIEVRTFVDKTLHDILYVPEGQTVTVSCPEPFLLENGLVIYPPKGYTNIGRK